MRDDPEGELLMMGVCELGEAIVIVDDLRRKLLEESGLVPSVC